MSVLDFLPATVDIRARPGDDISWRVIISDATGGLLDLAGATVTVVVGDETPTVNVTDPGIIDIALTDTQTATIGGSSVPWSLKVTKVASTTTYVIGDFTGSPTGNTSRNLVAGVVVSAASAFVQVVASGGGSGVAELDDLSDVVITAAASGDILRHNGTAWVDTPGTSHFDVAGTAASAVSAHEAAGDPHAGYALESALGTMAAQNAAAVAITGGTIAGTTQPASTISDFAEAVDDRVGVLVVGGAGITATYNDGAGTHTIATTITQYTDEMARDALGAALVAGSGITVTPNDGADTITIAASGGSSFSFDDSQAWLAAQIWS